MTGGGDGAALDGASPRDDIPDPFGGGRGEPARPRQKGARSSGEGIVAA